MSSAARPRVLIVEDDVPTATASRRLFTLWGWDVEWVDLVTDGVAALDRHFDLIMLDLVLPDGDGVEVFRAVRLLAHPARVAIATGSRTVDLDPGLRPDVLFKKPVVLVELEAFAAGVAAEVRR